jgi:DNA-binding MarR family transcriptional regulator
MRGGFRRIKDLISEAQQYEQPTPAGVRNHGKALPQEARVLAALREVPPPGWTTTRQLALVLGLKIRTLHDYLRSLRERGLVQTENGRGSRAVPQQEGTT